MEGEKEEMIWVGIDEGEDNEEKGGQDNRNGLQ